MNGLGTRTTNPEKRRPLEQTLETAMAVRKAIQKPVTESIDKTFRADLTSRFVSEMEKNGFILLNKEGSAHYEKYKAELDYLLDAEKGEMLFKRKDGSNFFVFARKEKGGIKVHFTNPDTSEKALWLKRDEIVMTHMIFSGREIDASISEIAEVSKNKDDKTLFTNMHSHLGYLNVGLANNNGKKMKHVADDGVSSDRDVIRNLLVANYDIDASGYHNCFDINDFGIISRLEEAVGIKKLPSLELTLPVEGTKQPLGFKNGVHLKVYANSPEAAKEFHQTFLVQKSRDLPGEAADGVHYRRMLNDIKLPIEEGVLALGLAHPAGRLSSSLKGIVGSCGALNFVEEGVFKFSDVINDIREYNMVVSNFNLTIKHTVMKPVDPEDGKTFRFLVKLGLRVGERKCIISEPNVNIGFGKVLEDITFSYTEPDKHHFHRMNYKSGVGSFLRAITVIRTKEPVAEVTGQWFVNGMHKKDPNFRMTSVVFGEPVRKTDGVYFEIVKERGNTFGEKITDLIASVREGANGAGHIIKEVTKFWWKKLFGKTEDQTNPES